MRLAISIARVLPQSIRRAFMSNVRRAGRLAGVALVVALTSGCSQAPGGFACDATLVASATALDGAMTALITLSGQMRASLAVACAAIASDLGQNPPAVGDGTMVSDATMQQVCTMATNAIKAAGKSTILIEGGKCQVDAQDQFDCEAQCDVNHKCQPPTVVTRCSPAELSVVCGGTCQAMATCEGSATVAAQCQGTCMATCNGTCSGACNGTCDGTMSTGTCAGTCQGECAGSCKGTCTGDCTLDANASINCGAQARCRGGCSGAYTQPVCESTLNPPSCTVDANCEAACQGQGSLKATCAAPSVVLVTAGSTALGTTLTKNLPTILQVDAQAVLVAKTAAAVATAAQKVSTALSNSAACALTAVDFAAQVAASLQASQTISVSVQASASVTAAVGP
jgi:hypothetical protein